MLEKIYWRAGPEAIQIIEQLCAERYQERRRRQELSDEVGAKYPVGTSCGSFSGFVFESEPDPKLWRKSKKPCADGTEFYTPLLRCKSGRRINEAMRSSQIPTQETLRQRFGFGLTTFVAPDGHSYLAGFGFEKLGDVWVIITYVGDSAVPPGCERLKNSEYWAIRESHVGNGPG